jgi:TonB-dependent Receptor Plug Domain
LALVIAGSLVVSTAAAQDEEQNDVIEVISEDVRSEPGVATLEREEVRRLPGAFGDPFRAIDALPGVTPTISGLPFFFVRGAPPGNVGYYLDGVSMPLLFHALGGPAVVHPALVEQVDVYRGAYPARFGRFAGGVVSARTTEPDPTWQGQASLRLIDAGAFVSGGFADGRGTVLFGGRYSYTGAIFSAISPQLRLDYRDAQARVTFDISEDDRISVLALASYDYYALTEAEVERPVFATEFYRVDTRYDARLEGGGQVEVGVTSGFDSTVMADGRRPRRRLVGSRAVLRQPLSNQVALDAGLDVQHQDFRIADPPYFDPDDPVQLGYNSLFRSRQEAAAGAWVGVDWRPATGVAVIPSLRADGFLQGDDHAVSVDPRLLIAVQLHERVRVTHALGTAHQPPSYLLAIPGLSPSRLDGGLQTALQSSAGVEVDIGWNTIGSVTAFNNVYLDLSDPAGTEASFTLPYELPRSTGTGRGLELSLRRSLAKRVGGFVSYTLSRTTRRRGSESSVASFDRTHVLSTAVGFDFGGGYLGGTRFNLYSGSPRFDGGVQRLGTSIVRDPPFYRFDVRFEKRWAISNRASLSLVLEVVNTTINAEILDGRRLIPVTLPSVGLEGKL